MTGQNELNHRSREVFDQLLEQVLEELPAQIRSLLEEVPLIVEDYPSRQIMREFDARHVDLRGLHTGIPLTERSVEHSGMFPESIMIFRRGTIDAAIDAAGRLDMNELKRQIRITLLHEVGHHYGFDEDDLAELGYE